MNATQVPHGRAGGGHHWILDLADCRCETLLLGNADSMQGMCITACQESGMQVVGACFHQFQPEGVTGTVLLAESHLAIHTWPELNYVALDVYVCDYSQNNAAKGATLVNRLRALMKAETVREHRVPRSSVRVDHAR